MKIVAFPPLWFRLPARMLIEKGKDQKDLLWPKAVEMKVYTAHQVCVYLVCIYFSVHGL